MIYSAKQMPSEAAAGEGPMAPGMLEMALKVPAFERVPREQDIPKPGVGTQHPNPGAAVRRPHRRERRGAAVCLGQTGPHTGNQQPCLFVHVPVCPLKDPASA